ncbi:MAG TPA: hypothetical protein VFE33_30745 [Thermoanaerobaculia bacterium]|nr:hypothetical protein [Thermoanaerobaculia bacterium]
MADRQLIVGVLDTHGRLGDSALEAKLRDFTLSLCRFDYDGPILESSSVDALLAAAGREGARYCLVQAHGHTMVRHGDRRQATHTNLVKALSTWLPAHDFLLAGRLVDGGDDWYGVDEIGFVVDLETYRALGQPRFTPAADGRRSLPAVAATRFTGPEGAGLSGLASLTPAAGTVDACPTLPGWGLIAASLAQGKPVLGFTETLERCGLDLRPRSATETASLARFSGAGILDFPGGNGGEANGSPLSRDWRSFLDYVVQQARNSKRGIFLGNFEGYEDVETPPAGFRGPVTGLYAVAAGFKANRILHTHGFDRGTRMVFFDYSPLALDLRRILVEEWDGVDFPDFVARIADRLPDAFYQLWGNLWATRPGALDLEVLGGIWERELALWGGAPAFEQHWARYREIPHLYLHCDLFAAPEPLGAALAPGASEVMWWSNAFHSLNGVWFYDREDRHGIYRRWLESLAAINPDLLLYGADVDNLDLGGVRLADHHRARREAPASL